MDPQRFDPDKLGPRSQAAYYALMQDQDIWDGGWHPWPKVIAKMLAASDILPKTCCDILRGMEWRGDLLRRGRYSSKRDGREAMFLDLYALDRSDCDSDEAYEMEMAKLEKVKKLHQRALSEARERYRGRV